MKCELIGGNLIITLPVKDPIEPSKSKKTHLVASTHGPQNTGVAFEGLDLIVSVNAYIKKRAT